MKLIEFTELTKDAVIDYLLATAPEATYSSAQFIGMTPQGRPTTWVSGPFFVSARLLADDHFDVVRFLTGRFTESARGAEIPKEDHPEDQPFTRVTFGWAGDVVKPNAENSVGEQAA